MKPKAKTISTGSVQACQNCKNSFTIEPEDFVFYEKMKVPPPTWCPECGMQRLMTWRNERSLYHRKDAFGKEIISIFAPEKSLVVYDQKKWWGDAWDPLDYGKDYDFSRPFFVQFKELFERVPLVALFNKNPVNSEYCNHTEDMKNSYLVFGSIWDENVLYSKGAIKSKDSQDVLFVDNSELNYESISCEGCYRLRFSRYCSSCSDSAFLIDCSGCSNCLGCVNLRNKSYYIFNKPYTKEGFEKKIAEFDFGSYEGLRRFAEEFRNFAMKLPYRFAHVLNSPGSTGDTLFDCKRCQWCFDASNSVEDCKHIINAGYSLKDSYRCYGAGAGELMYEVIDTGVGTSRVADSVVIRSGNEVFYSYNCHGSSNIFGSIGLRNKQYCLLNKQYSREEYESLLPKVVKHMNDMPYIDMQKISYTFGEFFPTELSPFAYNETIAQEYYPLTKEEAIGKGYGWRDPDEKNYTVTKEPEELPDNIKDVADSILKETIRCFHKNKCNEQCNTAFKVIPQELEFYRKMSIPLPRTCPNCRHYQRLRQRTAIRLWHRSCQCFGLKSNNGIYRNQLEHFHKSASCPNEFETSYAPDRPEIVYCEQCYQTEVV